MGIGKSKKVIKSISPSISISINYIKSVNAYIYGALTWFSQVFVFFLSQNGVLCFEKAKSHNLTK